MTTTRVPPVTWETTKRRHGTPSGAALHASLSERPCDACAKAKADYAKRRLGDVPAWREKRRLLAAAQSRAHCELARRHPDEYRSLYLAAKAEIERERRP